MRGGFRGMRFGDTGPGTPVPGIPGVVTNQPLGVPGGQGGNATQGKGINFVYQTPNVATLNAGAASGNQIIQFDNNSVFVWLRTTFTCDINKAAFTESTQPIPLITVNITDTGNGMAFMNAPVPIYAVAGYIGSLPFVLPVPQFVQPNASYAFNFTSYDAAVNYTNVRMQLHGFRNFNLSG